MKGIAFAMFAFWIAVLVGWIINIVELFSVTFSPLTAEAPLLTAEAVLRVVGIFVPPLGAVMGYFF